MMLKIYEPSDRHTGPILVGDEDHNDIAEFFHNEHATVGQSYETALALAQILVINEDILTACKKAAEWLSGWGSAEPYLAELQEAIARAETAAPLAPLRSNHHQPAKE